jgi:hypothetical protein
MVYCVEASFKEGDAMSSNLLMYVNFDVNQGDKVLRLFVQLLHVTLMS